MSSSYTKLIDLDLLDRFLTKIKTLIPTKTSDLTNDSGFVTRELPVVSASDNSKVLTVVNGSWAAANPSGSAPIIYTSTIPTTGWSAGEDGGVYQNISFSGVTFSANDPIFIDLDISTDVDADELLLNWDLIVRVTPIANTSNIRVLMFSEPDVALPVRIIKF